MQNSYVSILLIVGPLIVDHKINGTRFREASINGTIRLVIEGRVNATEGLRMRALPHAVQWNWIDLDQQNPPYRVLRPQML